MIGKKINSSDGLIPGFYNIYRGILSYTLYNYGGLTGYEIAVSHFETVSTLVSY